jgi:hypothetical protein
MKQQLKPLFDFAKSLEDFNKNIGYSPSTKLSDLPGNPLKNNPVCCGTSNNFYS